MGELVRIKPNEWEEKARWAASVLAKHAYRDCRIWEMVITYSETFFGAEQRTHFDRIADTVAKEKCPTREIKVNSRFYPLFCTFTAQEAYTIARSLEDL